MTLAELLVASAVLGLLLSGTFAVLEQGHQAYAFGAARVESQQSARAALSRIAYDVRVVAGGGSAGFPPIADAEPHRVVLEAEMALPGLGIAGGARAQQRLCLLVVGLLEPARQKRRELLA